VGIADLRNARGPAVTRPILIMLQRLLIAVSLLPAVTMQAHEIGTTSVHLTLHRDHSWSANITTAPQSLVNKLEAEARMPRSSDLGADALRAKLVELDGALARHVEVRFDGQASPAHISISQLEVPADVTLPAFVVLTARGAWTADAQAVTWRYGLVYSTYAVVFADESGGSPVTQWLDGDATSAPFPVSANVRPPSRVQIIEQYLRLGFTHIVPEGLDHILFVLGIFLLTTRLRPILVQVTAFTIAHSVTLGLTMYGIVSLPSRVVEPLIALSVAYVGLENIATSKLTPWRPVVVFGFGLLHGMGFAGALTGLRLPRDEVVPALISFNVGIELAQLTVIAVAFFAIAFWIRDKPWYRTRFVVPVSALIAATGLFWTVQRTLDQ
jgi:hydrogenase/urease accessory protein HupE